MDMLRLPSAIGARGEAAVASALVRAGRMVFLPAFAAHARVDLVYLGMDGPIRVQCKSARIANGIVAFKTCSYTANRPRPYTDECTLRIDPTINGQSAGIRWAGDYLLGPP